MPHKVECYWDGNSGAVVYDDRQKSFTSKMNIPSVTYDRLTYSLDDNVAVKYIGTTKSTLTTEEIQAIETFANANAEESVIMPVDIENHNSDPNSHPDIRQELSDLQEQAYRTLFIATQEDTLTSPLGAHTESFNSLIDDYGYNFKNGSFKANKSENFDITAYISLSNIQGTIDSNSAVNISILKNNTSVLTSKDFNLSTQQGIYKVSLSNAVLAVGDTISVRLSFTNCSNITGAYLAPFRNYLVVESHGGTAGESKVNLLLGTLGNLMFFEGYELAIRPDDANKPSAVAGTWNNTIIS